MRQVIQVYKNGRLRILSVPVPRTPAGSILVRTATPLVSVGTEKYMLELARKSLLGKALARLDLGCRVIAKAQAKSFTRYHQQFRL